MRRSTIATLATVAGVALVGGGAYAVTQIPGDEPTTSATTEPGVIDTPAADPSSTPAPQVTAGEPVSPSTEDADALFLAEVADRIRPTTQIADVPDEDLIAAGHQACEQIEAGVALEDLRLVEGEQPGVGGYYLDTSAIFNSALIAYCPELMTDID